MGKLIDEINKLAKKSKTVGLTPEETIRRDQLRQEYLKNFRSNFKNQLDCVKIADE